MSARRLGLLVLALAACGDVAQDGSYHGEVLAELRCTFGLTPELVPPGVEQSLGLVWLTEEGERVATHPHDARAETPFPAAFLFVYTEPPAELVTTRGDIGAVALGQVVLFIDTSGDDLWQEDEPLLGTGDDLVLVYAPTAVSGGQLGTFAPGFHLMVPAPCDPLRTSRFAGPNENGCVVRSVVTPDPFFRFTCP